MRSRVRTITNVLEVAVKWRDRVSDELTFHSSYPLEGHIVNPDELTHLSNEIDLALRYQLAPKWESKLGYRLTLDSFTTVNRTDFQQQVTGAIIYRLTNQFFIEGRVAYRVGNPDAFRAGIRVGYDLGLF